MSSLTGTHSSGKKRKVVKVILLNKEEHRVYVDVKSKFREVFNAVATLLSLRETEYFGLALLKDGEYHFVTLDEKISKQAVKGWKSGQGEGVDASGQPLLTVYYRVQFYVDLVVLLREKVTRHLYYLQLKENVLHYKHLCSEEHCFQLAASALQADFGNYHPEKHKAGYFDPREYFPGWMVDEHGRHYLIQNAPKMHKDQRSITRNESELRFIREASQHPAAHNLHFYRMRKKKLDKVWNAWLGICAKGVEIYEEIEGGFKSLLSTFLWPDIEKLYFDKKKFEIRSVGKPEGRKFTYYTDSDYKSKYILSICRGTHMFQMDMQPKLMEIRHLDAEDKRRYRESYIYSDPRDLVVNGGLVPHRNHPATPRTGGITQRYSAISDTSSNTTSGIVSDKVTISFDDSEDHGKEIIIDSPPRASLLNTPGQGRNKFTAIQPRDVTLQNFKSGSSGSNKSPKFDSRPLELYKSGGRSGSIQTSSSPHTLLSLASSYRNRLQQQQQAQHLFNNKLPLQYPISASTNLAQLERSSQPVSRSASRGDSFKQMQLQRQQQGEAQHKDGVKNDPQNEPSASFYTLPPPLTVQNATTIESKHLPKSLPTIIASTSYNAAASAAMNQSLPQSTTSPAVTDKVGSAWTTNIVSVGIEQVSGPVNGAWTPDQASAPVGTWASVVAPITAEKISTVANGQWKTISPVVSEQVTGPWTNFDPLVTDQASVPISGTWTTLSPNTSEQVQTTEMAVQDIPESLPLHVLFADIMPNVGTDPPSGNVGCEDSHEQTNIAVPDQENTMLVVSDASSPSHLSDFNSENSLEQVGSGSSQISQEQSLMDRPDSPGAAEKKRQRTKISLKNQKEILHPELEKIRVGVSPCSFPFMSALFNDRSLMQNSNGSFCSTDTGTMRSTDSRISQASHETDPRRLSSSYPTSTGTMITFHTNRPFSWHNETFDLDSQLAASSYAAGVTGTPPSTCLSAGNLDNHSSTSHALNNFKSALPAASWTHSVAYSMPYSQSLHSYSPQLLATQHMIPSKLSSGGHDKNDSSIPHKTLKENIGIA